MAILVNVVVLWAWTVVSNNWSMILIGLCVRDSSSRISRTLSMYNNTRCFRVSRAGIPQIVPSGGLWVSWCL